jgi:hypothetical protein
MSKVLTNNSFLKEKIDLRINQLDINRQYKVLECYAGEGLIWDQIQAMGYQIEILRIEKEKSKKAVLKGDNVKWLLSLDLNEFDIIDLDAYGVPFEQMEILFQKEYHGIVFVTFIQTIMGQLPYGLLNYSSYSKSMIKKIPTLFGKNAWFVMEAYLSKKGIKEVQMVDRQRKKYFSFFC